jgi:hypothetical protein
MTDKLLSEDEVFAQATSVKEPTTPKVDEQDILFPTEHSWTVNGEKVTVTEFKFMQLSKLMRLAKIVFGHMGKANDFGTFLDSDLSFFETHGEEMLELLAANTNKPAPFFNTIPQEIALEMMIKLMEINVRFFTNRVMPVLAQKA